MFAKFYEAAGQIMDLAPLSDAKDPASGMLNGMVNLIQGFGQLHPILEMIQHVKAQAGNDVDGAQ